MKVIFICTKSITFNTFLKSQADYLIKKGFRVEVACSDIKNLNFSNKLNYKISFPNKIFDLFNLFNYLMILLQINKLVKKNPKAIFYLHTPVASHLFRFFTFFKNLKIIYFVHGFRFSSTTNFINNIFFKFFEKILSFNTKIFITINKEDHNYCKSNFSKKKLFFKVNGIGLSLTEKHFKKKLTKKKLIKKILVISAYKKDKGYLEILKLADILKNKNIKICCFGYGNKTDFHYIKIKNKVKNISFNSFDLKLHNKIKNFDILLHLSKREGLPVSVMQSLSQGLPVICYNIRGNNDLIIDKFNGYFVSSYKEVPKKIFYLNLENDVYNQMRLNAFQSINKAYFKKQINLDIYNIIQNYSKNHK